MRDGPKRHRWLKITLFASLAVNLAVAGLFAGMVLREDGPWHRADRGPRHEGFLYLRAFTEDQREDLRRAFHREMGQAKSEHGDRKAAFRERFFEGYEEAAAALRREPFDREALEKVLETQAARSREGRARGQRVLLDFLTDLPPEARADYADRLLGEIEEMSRP